MSQSIVVTGGTGTLGRPVVARLLEAGHTVRILSRHAPATPSPAEHSAVDMRTGEGLDQALGGAEVVIHCASAQRGDLVAAGHLLDAVRRAGVRHLVYISIVGVDRVPFGYYRTKLAVEQAVEAAGVPWTILRTTQFHNLVVGLWAAQRRLPVVFVPAVSFQPIEVGEVAERLVGLAIAEPAGRVADMGGPRVRTARDLARTYLRASGSRRPTVPVRLPGKTFAGYRSGAHLAPDHAVGVRTYDEFLAGR